MATVSLIDPYSQQAEQIARRQRMAQALQERGSQVLEMPTMPGVSISPYAGLAKVLESGIGAYQEKKAQDDYKKLQTDYRNAYNTQFGDLAKAISAPAVPGVEGQEAVAPQEAVTEPIYGTMPDPTYGGFDVGLQTQDPSNVIGQKEISPSVPGREAIAAKAGVPAGYISPETLKGIDIPEVKQLAMARYLAQFEPKQVKLGKDDSLYNQVGFGPLTPLVTASIKADKLTPHWVEGQKDVNGTTQFGWYDLNAADKDASFKAGANPPAGEKSNWKEVTRDEKVFYEDFNIADATQRQAKARVKEVAKIDRIQLEVEDETGAKKTILVNKDDSRLAAGISTKGADTVMITEVNDKGQTAVRYVKKGDPILTTGYVKPLDGFLGQLQQAGVPIDRIQSDPKIRDLVDRYFVKTAGGVAPEETAGFELRKAEVIARLGELGIAIPANIKGLSLSVTPGVLGGAQSTSAAPAAVGAGPVPTDADRARAKSSASSRANFIRHFGVEP